MCADYSCEGSNSEPEADARAASDADASVATIQLDMPRRSMQVSFTCDKCGASSSSGDGSAKFAPAKHVIVVLCIICRERPTAF